MLSTKRNFWIIWIATAVLSFLAFFIGVRFILHSTVLARNLIAYVIFSVVFGAVAGGLYLLKLKITAISFLAGLLVGFGMMYRAFLSELSGWEDLAGFMSLFIWMGVGLFVGAVIQLARWIYLRMHSDPSEPNK